MPESTPNPAPPPPNTTRLRTVVGNRYPRKCAGCHETIPVGLDVKTVVDFGAPKPFPAYHAEHSPDAGRFRGRPRTQEATPTNDGFQPASALLTNPVAASLTPASSPRASPVGEEASLGKAPAPLPSVPDASLRGESPRDASSRGSPLLSASEPGAASSASTRAPLALLGADRVEDPAPSPLSGSAWATSQLTFQAAPYESAKAGFADYALPGESGEQLRARVHRVVLADLENQVRAMRELHGRLGDVPQRKGALAPT